MKTLISDLHLSTWNGDAKDDAIIDLFVPAEKVVDLEEATVDLDTEVMHEDLGASIAEESSFGSFSGTLQPRAYVIMKLKQADAVFSQAQPILRGSNHITLCLTICAG